TWSDPDSDTAPELILALLSSHARRPEVHHAKLFSDSLDGSPIRHLGLRAEPVPTNRARLYPGDTNRGFTALKDSARRNIRRAAKLGLVARIEEQESLVAEHYGQLREVFVRGGNTVSFDQERVGEFFRRMRAAGELLAVA